MTGIRLLWLGRGEGIGAFTGFCTGIGCNDAADASEAFEAVELLLDKLGEPVINLPL